MQHWIEDGTRVHCRAANGDDRTLCGVILEGIDGISPLKETDSRINCDHCIQIIEHCYKVRPGEMVITRRERV